MEGQVEVLTGLLLSVDSDLAQRSQHVRGS